MTKTAKMRHCYFCGDELGVYADYDRFDTCGKKECDSDARDSLQAEREEAHEQLDRDNGWA
jgi:hypothetical protein